jgi:Polyketide cyclase / dehydrase and lipid transport
VVTRVFEAPIEQVWDALSDPGLMRRWWGPVGAVVPVTSVPMKRLGCVLRYGGDEREIEVAFEDLGDGRTRVTVHYSTGP